MLFKLINASAIFQTYINKFLIKLIDDFCVMYLNNILIFFETKTNHLNHVKQMLKRLRRSKLYVSLRKYEFFTTKVDFLEFVIFTESVSMNSSKVDIIVT